MWTEQTLAPLIQQAATKYGLDPKMFFGQLKHESMNFNPDVLSGKRTSSAGALGIAQFMPGTAREMGVDPRDVPAAIDAGARYMAKLKQSFGGDEALARQAYNWGPGNLQQHLKNPKSKPLPAETANYNGHVAKAAGAAPVMAAAKPDPKAAIDAVVNGPAPMNPSDFNGWRSQLSAMVGDQGQSDPTLSPFDPGMHGIDLMAHDATAQDNLLAGVFSDNPQPTPENLNGLPRSIDSFLEKILTA